MKKISVGSVLLILLFGVYVYAEAATVIPYGAISANTTWTKEGSPYVIESEVYVGLGTVLTLEPGVILKFKAPSSAIFTSGTIIAHGTPEDPIYFTSYKNDSAGGDTNGDGDATEPAPGDWDSVYIVSGQVDLDNVVAEYGGRFAYASAFYNKGNLSVSDSKFRKNKSIGIYQEGGESVINKSEFYDQSTGFYQAGGKTSISQSSFHDNKNYGVYRYLGNTIEATNNFWGDSSGPYHETLNPSGQGDKVSSYVNFQPFLTEDPTNLPPPPLTLPEKAAELAKEVIGADYLGDGDTFGGKGWDMLKQTYVDVASVFNGYDYWNNKLKKINFGAGLDCSGLIEWAYNYSFDPEKSLTKNVIRVEGADAQYRKNSNMILESELTEGDLLFLDKDNNDRIDHVAVYVRNFIKEGEYFEIVEAFSPQLGILPTTLDEYKSRQGFKNLSDENPIRRVAISPSIAGQVKVGSPVDISVTDPEGITITPNTFIQTDAEYLREVPGELYYSERELGADGRPRDTVYL